MNQKIIIFVIVLLCSMPTEANTSKGHPFAYVANMWSNNVSVIDLKTNQVVKSIQVGKWPNSIRMNSAGTLVYVGNDGDQNISVINTVTNHIIMTIPVFGVARGIEFSPDESKIYVANQGNNRNNHGAISIIDIISNKYVSTITGLGAHTQHIAVDPLSSTIYVTSQDSNQLFAVDMQKNTITGSISINNPFCLTLHLSKPILYVTNSALNKVSIINTDDLTITKTLAVGKLPQNIFLNSDGSKVYVSNSESDSVSIISTDDNTVIRTIENAGSYPREIAEYSAENKLYTTNYGTPPDLNNTVNVIDSRTYKLIGSPITVGNGPIAICIGYVPVNSGLSSLFDSNVIIILLLLITIIITYFISNHFFHYQSLEKLVFESAKALTQKDLDLIKEKEARLLVEKEMQYISEREQTRIGQDIHDTVIQQLTGVKMIGESFLKDPHHQPELENQYIQRLNELLLQSIQQLRSLSQGLYPVELHKNGLHKALQELASTVQDIYKIKCTYNFNQSLSVKGDMILINVFRIVQEAVNNAVKHSNSTSIDIQLNQEDDLFIIKVIDDGKGFDMTSSNTPDSSGMGLNIMKYRADIIGADLSIWSQPNIGTTIQCKFQLVHQ